MLSNKVSEIMTTHLTTAPVASSIHEVLEMMVTADVGRVIITNREVPVGIFTEKDVMKRVVNEDIDPARSRIKDVMTSPLRAVREETHIVEAFAKMYKGKYRHLLVRGVGHAALRPVQRHQPGNRCLRAQQQGGATLFDAALPGHHAADFPDAGPRRGVESVL